MSKKEQDTPVTEPVQEQSEECKETPVAEETQAAEDAQETAKPTEEETLKMALQEQEDKYLRLAAEYDNFRKRSQKEKESAWSQAKAETAAAFLPVYDNLDRALKQETADEAYAKGVQMTMNQLKEVLEKLGIEEIPALGATFDPALHNAVMHVDDESQKENTVVEVFQSGFQSEGKVIRFAMVKVAN